MKKLIKTLKKKLKNFNPKLKEECGVFGISDSKDAAALTALGLHALQHRGQEGCGIVSFDGSHYFSEKRFGLVGDNFNKEKILNKLRGNYAIGHNRYSTTGENTYEIYSLFLLILMQVVLVLLTTVILQTQFH